MNGQELGLRELFSAYSEFILTQSNLVILIIGLISIIIIIALIVTAFKTKESHRKITIAGLIIVVIIVLTLANITKRYYCGNENYKISGKAIKESDASIFDNLTVKINIENFPDETITDEYGLFLFCTLKERYEPNLTFEILFFGTDRNNSLWSQNFESLDSYKFQTFKIPMP